MPVGENTEIRNRLLAWFSQKGRDFVWRRNPTPFTILIAEILLKRTAAAAVNGFICEFLSRFPSPASLVSVDHQDLVISLGPLGLSNQRAQQLRQLGEALMGLPGETIPDSRERLLSLPGVGEYTAAAILCFAYGKAEALVDSNVSRIVSRVRGIARPSRFEARRSPEVWENARELIGDDETKARSLNWALLDLGAMVCRPRNPKCGECPLQGVCTYAKSETKSAADFGTPYLFSVPKTGCNADGHNKKTEALPRDDTLSGFRGHHTDSA